MNNLGVEVVTFLDISINFYELIIVYLSYCFLHGCWWSHISPTSRDGDIPSYVM